MGPPSPHGCDNAPWGCPRPWSLAQHCFHPCIVSYQTWLALSLDLLMWGQLSHLLLSPMESTGPSQAVLPHRFAFLHSLRGNSIGVAGAKAMANALKVNRSLRRLK